ncbi:carbohydrate sulfotransferase 11-like [Tigriopus californicus]|uniref:carbohydrate sulfotransferase 11-like n=1 Tax=Tigriopus californicus TaxID=6832 RepID=UPI0027DA7089|nr:carbohydrate sulfotransferase 11-like [Tigriopus californicus]
MGLAIDGKHRFGFCWNNKAASTSLGSWMVEVTNTSKYLQTQGYHKILSSMRPQSLTELEKFVINGHLFIVVRHPFARVVSAFNDRIIGDPQSYQSRKFVPLIKKKLELQLNPKRALQFRHFVAYLLSTPTRLYDPHWSPMWLHCAPCQIPYRQIVKVETLVQDFHFLQERIPNFPHHALPFLHQSQRGTEKETIRKHWQELNGLEKATFFKIYQNDFLLFDYDVHEFE